MSTCGCTYQDANCVEGKRLLDTVMQAYQRLTGRPRGEVDPARQEQKWHAYVQARDAYFEHIGEAGKLRCAYCGENSLDLIPCFLCGCLSGNVGVWRVVRAQGGLLGWTGDAVAVVEAAQ